MNSGVKRVYRISAYSVYDYEKVEKYLEEMALKGYIFESVFCGVMSFKKAEPIKMRYRLEAVSKKQEESDETEYYESCGWKKADSWHQFRIWYTSDENTRELNTDSFVEVIALKNLKNKLLSNLISIALYFVFLSFLIFYAGTTLIFIELGSIISFSAVLIFNAYFLLCAWRVFFFSKRIKALKNEEIFSYDNKSSIKRRVFSIILLFSFIVWCGFFLSSFLKHKTGAYKMPISEFEGELPFASLSDFVEGGKVEQEYNLFNFVSARDDILAPRIIELNQSGSVFSDKSKGFRGGINVQYYELISEKLAKRVFKELYFHDKTSKYYEEGEVLSISVDEAMLYQDVFTVLLIREKNKVARVSFYQAKDKEDINWVQTFVDSLK